MVEVTEEAVGDSSELQPTGPVGNARFKLLYQQDKKGRVQRRPCLLFSSTMNGNAAASHPA